MRFQLILLLLQSLHTSAQPDVLAPTLDGVSDSGAANQVSGIDVSPSAGRSEQISAARRLVLKPESNGSLTKKSDFATQILTTSTNFTNAPIFDANVAQAAALLAESDTATRAVAGPVLQKRQGRFWMEDIEHLGSIPFGNDPSYHVFRNVVKDFGADPSGRRDSTMAINNAIASGKRCGANCYSSSTKNAIVYFPPGNYLVSSTIIALYGTQLIGDANDRPHIIASPQFVGTGVGVISTDQYVGGGAGIDGRDIEYYINTANFYRQIRNLVIDIPRIDIVRDDTAALHYQVSQATSLHNVHFVCSKSPDTQQKAIFAENGSGGFMSDLSFEGGRWGIYGGNQQFTAHRLRFENVRTAISVIWDWGWTWKNIQITGADVGFNLTGESSTIETGSILIQDSKFENVANAIVAAAPSPQHGRSTTGITLDNVQFSGVRNAIIDVNHSVWLAGNIGAVDTFVLGPQYTGFEKTFALGKLLKTPRSEGLTQLRTGLPKPIYFERPRAQYGDVPASQIVSVKKYGAKGDGISDDTVYLQNIITQAAAQKRILYINAGSYIITDTIYIPPGSRIVGELWSQLVARGPNFSDGANPRPMLRVGKPGDRGSIELQDLLFTNIEQTKGLIGVEWNIEADAPGAAALWDCHFRIGGAIGTGLTSKECPPSRTGIDQGCMAGALMLHITPSASAYMENLWAWVADHDLDDADLTNPNNTMPQLSVYMARGILVESQKPTWLYGTASEHSTLYQYSFHKARQIHAGMVQTESPYYQPNPRPPLPFSKNMKSFPGDPDYRGCVKGITYNGGCDSSWAIRIEKSSDISFAGAGLYSWFKNYDESCVDSRSCQMSLVDLRSNGKNVIFMNFITIGSLFMATSDKGAISAPDNEANTGHPKWSHIGLFELSGPGFSDNVVYIDPIVWHEPSPTVKCNPPCTLVLPPSTLSSATTINIPPLVTTLEVGWVSTGYFTGIIVTTTLYIAPVVTQTIEFSNVLVSSPADLSVIVPTMSVLPPPFVITDVYPPGITHSPPVRTITPEPFPPSGSEFAERSSQTTGSYVYGDQTVVVGPRQSITKTVSNHTLIFLPTGIIVDGRTQIAPPKQLPTVVEGITIETPRPYRTVDPTRPIEYITSSIAEPTTVVVDGKVEPVIPCHAWFWFFCIPGQLGGLVLFGMEAPGIYPLPPVLPPRPNIIPVPQSWPPLPKAFWPEITIGPDLKPTYRPRDEDEPCETSTMSVCTTTLSKATGTISSTRTFTQCSAVTGCHVTASATTTTTSVCLLPTQNVRARSKRAFKKKGQWAIVFPKNAQNIADNDNLDRAIMTEVGSTRSIFGRKPIIYRSQSKFNGWTMFWAVERMTDEEMATIRCMRETKDVYRPEGGARNVQRRADGEPVVKPNPMEALGASGGEDVRFVTPPSGLLAASNLTLSATRPQFHQFEKRAIIDRRTKIPEMVLISTPEQVGGLTGDEANLVELMDDTYYFDDFQGMGQTVYALEWGYRKDHEEFTPGRVSPLFVGPVFTNTIQDKIGGTASHGTCVAAKIIGKTIGLATNAQVVVTVMHPLEDFNETWLDGLLKIFDDIMSTAGRRRTSIVNISIQGPPMVKNGAKEYGGAWHDGMIGNFAMLVAKLLDEGVPVVTGAGNRRPGAPRPLNGYPAMYALKTDPWHGGMDNLIVAGTVNKIGIFVAKAGNSGPEGVDVYAPAHDIHCPGPSGEMSDEVTGTSFASPQVAALLAYWKTLRPSLTLSELKHLGTKENVRALAPSENPLLPEEFASKRNIIWNRACLPQPISKTALLSKRDGSRVARDEHVGVYGNLTDYDRVTVPQMMCRIPRIPLSPQSRGDGPSLIFSSALALSPTCLGIGCGRLCGDDSPFCWGNPRNSSDFPDPLDPRSQTSTRAFVTMSPSTTTRSYSSPLPASAPPRDYTATRPSSYLPYAFPLPSATPTPSNAGSHPPSLPGPPSIGQFPRDPSTREPLNILFWRRYYYVDAQTKLNFFVSRGSRPDYNIPLYDLDENDIGWRLDGSEIPSLPSFNVTEAMICSYHADVAWPGSSQDQQIGTISCIDRATKRAYLDGECVHHDAFKDCAVYQEKDRKYHTQHYQVMMGCTWRYPSDTVDAAIVPPRSPPETESPNYCKRRQLLERPVSPSEAIYC